MGEIKGRVSKISLKKSKVVDFIIARTYPHRGKIGCCLLLLVRVNTVRFSTI